MKEQLRPWDQPPGSQEVRALLLHPITQSSMGAYAWVRVEKWHDAGFVFVKSMHEEDGQQYPGDNFQHVNDCCRRWGFQRMCSVD